jgi:FMN phosphatase YigB (HAD superfamily)
MKSRLAVLFDIDGTLADVDHRVHLVDPNRKGGKDWDGHCQTN